MATVLTLFFVVMVSSLLASLTKVDFDNWAGFIMPMIIILDFSARFFMKKDITAAIFPYLSLPIARKTLILYIILSDLQRFWVWGCSLVYSLVLYFFVTLTFQNLFPFILFILVNNYSVALMKILIKIYTPLIYPIAIGCIILLQIFIYCFNPILALLFSMSLLTIIVFGVYLALKENLSDELNQTAL